VDAATVVVNVLLIAAVAHAVVTDVRHRRVSNWVTYPMAAIGIIANAYASGWPGFYASAAGWLLGFGILLIPNLLGAMGTGDVKLLAAIGALKGVYFVLLVTIYMGLAGGVLALAYLAWKRGATGMLRFVAGGWWRERAANPNGSPTMPYAPAIAAGAILALLHVARLS
jgi:prepilin peptidase CpaA